jgi:hypothetical protein
VRDVNVASKAGTLARNEYLRVRRSSRDAASRRYLRRQPQAVPPAQVMAHFADDDPELYLYQLRQWYRPLEALSQAMPTVISVRKATVARVVAQECSLPLVYMRTLHDMENYMTTADPRVVLYVNQSVRNFQLMRYGRPMHVFISHGESEKGYMSSGQLRAYDFAFIAGQAAQDRILGSLPNYDPAQRTRQIGRPQLDFLPADRSGRPGVKTVFYAPTWEGDRPSMAYGSIESAGRQAVGSLLMAGYRVIYRPHPLSGTHSPSYRQADRKIRVMLNRANARLAPGRAPNVIDTASQIDDQIAESDIAVVDNSAMAFDWLVTGKPLIVTVPAAESAVGANNSFLSACYRLTAAGAGAAADLVSEALARDTLHAQREYWVHRHFGDVSRGASTKRFIEATAEVAEYGQSRIRATQQRSSDLAARDLGPGSR